MALMLCGTLHIVHLGSDRQQKYINAVRKYVHFEIRLSSRKGASYCNDVTTLAKSNLPQNGVQAECWLKSLDIQKLLQLLRLEICAMQRCFLHGEKTFVHDNNAEQFDSFPPTY